MIETGQMPHRNSRLARAASADHAGIPNGTYAEFDAAYKRLQASGRLKKLSWRGKRREEHAK